MRHEWKTKKNLSFLLGFRRTTSSPAALSFLTDERLTLETSALVTLYDGLAVCYLVTHGHGIFLSSPWSSLQLTGTEQRITKSNCSRLNPRT